MKKNDKKLSKKSVDIESEFVGIPVGPVGKKEKKADLTDEINFFLENEITHESIKNILFRLDGQIKTSLKESALMNIYYIPQKKRGGFYIFSIDTEQFYNKTYILTNFELIKLCSFKFDDVCTSPLKSMMRYKIWVWCTENPDKIKKIN